MHAIKLAILFWKKCIITFFCWHQKYDLRAFFFHFLKISATPLWFSVHAVSCYCHRNRSSHHHGSNSQVSPLLTGSSFHGICMREDCLSKPKGVCQVSRVQTVLKCILKQAKLSSMLQAQSITVFVIPWPVCSILRFSFQH